MANYKNKIRIAKYNRRGDVVMHCLSPPSYSLKYFLTSLMIIRKRYVVPNTTCEVMWPCTVSAIEHSREKCESSLGIHALNYVTSSVILRLAKVGRRSYRRYVRNTLRNGLVRWSTAILTYLSVLLFQIINVSNVRFHARDFYLADVGL